MRLLTIFCRRQKRHTDIKLGNFDDKNSFIYDVNSTPNNYKKSSTAYYINKTHNILNSFSDPKITANYNIDLHQHINTEKKDEFKLIRRENQSTPNIKFMLNNSLYNKQYQTTEQSINLNNYKAHKQKKIFCVDGNMSKFKSSLLTNLRKKISKSVNAPRL